MRFNVIKADPPWQYDNVRTGGSMRSGAQQKYPGMTLKELMEVPVKQVSQRNAVLFLWVTIPMLQEGIILLNHWGFKYKTSVTWVKKGRLGLGYWMRGEVEMLLLGVRGEVKAFRSQIPNWVVAPKTEHSRKPAVFDRIISDLITPSIPCPDKLELFARRETPGWMCVGNEIQKGIHVNTVMSQWL